MIWGRIIPNINLKKERQATVGPSGDGLRWSCQLDLENGAWRYEKKGVSIFRQHHEKPGLTWKSYEKPWFSNLEKLRIAMEKSMAFLISHETMAGNRPSALSVEPLQAGHAPFWRAELQPAK